MKQFRTFVALLGIAATLFALPATAQLRMTNSQPVIQGNTIYLTGLNQTPQDSLQVSDSIAYSTYIQHTNDVSCFLTWFWNKIGTGNPTVTLTFWQSNDNVNWFQCTQGVLQTNYTKNFSPTANTWYSVDFARDSIRFSGRYLKTYFITGATASTKGKLIAQLKTNIK